MPEAIAITFVVLVSIGTYVFARIQMADPSKHDPSAEQKQSEQRLAWLQERLDRAKKEQWDHQMVASLTEQLAAAKIATAR